MFMNLQVLETGMMKAAPIAATRAVAMKANIALLLALIIISTLSGVVLIV